MRTRGLAGNPVLKAWPRMMHERPPVRGAFHMTKYVLTLSLAAAFAVSAVAQQTAQQAHARIATVEDTVSKIDQFQPVTQAEIRFRPGQAALSKNAKEALDQMATSLKNQRGYIVEVQGFSPGNGTSAIENSREMAQMVVRYLVLNHDVPVYRIYTVGMGNAPIQAENGKMTRQKGGRVEISLLKNGLGDLNASNNGSASSSGSGVTATPAQPSSTQPATQPATQPNTTEQPAQKPPQP